jgi:hypothetical protein
MDNAPVAGHREMVKRRSLWPRLTALFVALAICGIALGGAHEWASTGRPVGAYVTDCAADGGYRCDYRWTAGGSVFAGRLPGQAWQNGHPVRLWVNPNDPTDVDANKDVLAPAVWFALFGLGLLACAFTLPGRTASLFGAHTHRGVAIATAICAVAAAATPTTAILVQASRMPPVTVPALTARAVLSPVLQQVVPRGSADQDVDDACATTVAAGDSQRLPLVDNASTTIVELRDRATGREVTHTLAGVIWSVALAPDGSFATGDVDGVVRLWDEAGRRVTTTIIGNGLIKWIAFSPDGRTLAIAGDTVQLWDIRGLRTTATITLGDTPWRVGFSVDGHTLSVCDESGVTRRWRV